ncbi:MAG: N-formylglutamate amidohydrolase [Myxococcales bacterium]|nr:N-formylglutamate amidohydrolase [Myxococcales bacterium]
MTVFDLERPIRGETPVLVEIPHAGLEIPETYRSEIVVSPKSIRSDADIYVDELYRGATYRGATVLAARYSRYVVDLNRAQDDLDAETVRDHPSAKPHQPRGVVWRITIDGDRCMPQPLSRARFETRLDACYRPYHGAIASELVRLRERFGHAILVAAHSMPSVGRIGHADSGVRRADVVPGTRGRTTAHPSIIDLVDSHFRAAGLSVRHDQPYRGGFSTRHYGRPKESWHAIQIELNRALYVDETTHERKEADLERLRQLLLGLVEKLGTLRL